MVKDRRRYARHNTELPANYSFAPSSFFKKLNGDTATCKGIIKDMSPGGIRLDAWERLNKSMHVIVEILLKSGEIHVSMSGKVIWTKKLNDITTCGIKLNWVSNESAYSDFVEMLRLASDIY